MYIKKLLTIMPILIMFLVLISVFEVKADTTSGFWSYEEYSDGTVGITAYSGLDEDITIPSEIEGKKVTKIANKAFRNNQNIKNVIISSTVTSIGHQAFAGSGLVSVVIPDSVVSWKTESDSELPSGNKSGRYEVHNSAFAECKNLKNVVINSEIIPSFCFCSCEELTSVTFGEKTKYIHEYAFAGARKLNSVIVKSDLLEIGRCSFRNCESLTSILLGNKLTSLGHQAFAGSGLTSITVPDTVTSWGTAADSELPSGKMSGRYDVHNSTFAECKSLKNVVIKSETIPLYCFYNCEELTSVTFGEKTKYIREFAFEGARKLSTAIVKSDLLEIGRCSFRNCENLTNISLGNKLISLGHQAFAGSGLTSITVPDTVASWETAADSELPSGRMSGRYDVHNSTFAECKNLKNIVIKSETIPLYCFYNCEELTSVTLGEKTKYIREFAFEGAGKLSTVIVKSDLLEIGRCSFRYCKNLTSISLGKKMTKLGHQAFAGSGLISVTIPDTVTTWETAADSKLPSGKLSGRYESHNSTFAECENLKDIYIGNTTIPGTLLYGSNSVTIHCMQDTSAHNYAINNGFSYEIYESIPSTSMELVTKEYTLVLGETLRLYPIMTPENSTDTVSWVTGNANIATVDSTGLVNAKTTGLVAMKCTTSSGQSYTFSINIVSSGETTVDNEPDKQISLSTVEGIVDKEYTGKPVIQDITVRFNPYTELIENVHYKVIYKNNVDGGTASITVKAIEGSGYVGEITKTFAIKGGAMSVIGKVNATQVYVGDKVVIKAIATGGSENYTYSYIVYNRATNEWYRLADNITSDTYTWKASSKGERVFYVEVKDTKGNVVRSSALKVNVALKLAVTAKVTASKVVVGDKVKITALATGGSGKYTYSYIVYNKETNKWFRLADNISSNTYTWKATDAGSRVFYVEIKDSKGKIVRSKAINVDVSERLSIVAKTSATDNVVKQGDNVKFLGLAEGGVGEYTYSYIVYNKTTNKWCRLADNVLSDVYTWKASSKGERVFYIEVKDSTGKVVRSKALSLTVK